MSEGTFFNSPVPGGGTDMNKAPCGAKPEPGLFSVRVHCTLAPGHEGWHEAGTAPGMMVATWSDDE